MHHVPPIAQQATIGHPQPLLPFHTIPKAIHCHLLISVFNKLQYTADMVLSRKSFRGFPYTENLVIKRSTAIFIFSCPRLACSKFPSRPSGPSSDLSVFGTVFPKGQIHRHTSSELRQTILSIGTSNINRFHSNNPIG